MAEGSARTNLLDSIRRDIVITASNYAQMHDRLRLRDGASKLFVTYYSVFAILFSLMPFFFEEQITHRALFDFLTVSMSIVVLVASLLISFAKYSERALQAVKALDDLKRLKKELSKYTDDDMWDDECKRYNSCVKRYHQIVDRMELRTDIDYYRSCKNLSTKTGFEDSWKNLSWFSKFLAHSARIIEYFGYVLLILFPLGALCWCFKDVLCSLVVCTQLQ